MEGPVRIILGIILVIANLERRRAYIMAAGTAQKSSSDVFNINAKMGGCVFLTLRTDNTDLAAYVQMDIPEYTVKQ